MLAALLLNASRVVPVEELAETLWGAAPPPSARVTVQNYLVRLRKALGDEGHCRTFLRLGRYEQAAGYLQQALALASETGDREDEADALNGLGEVLLGTGQPGQAGARHAVAEAALSRAGRA